MSPAKMPSAAGLVDVTYELSEASQTGLSLLAYCHRPTSCWGERIRRSLQVWSFALPRPSSYLKNSHLQYRGTPRGPRSAARRRETGRAAVRKPMLRLLHRRATYSRSAASSTYNAHV